MLAKAQRGEKIECHRRDEIVIFWRSDISAVMQVARLQAEAKIFAIIRRRFHLTSLVSRWRAQNSATRLLAYREIQAHPATGQIDRCGSVAACGMEIREVCRPRVRSLRREHSMLSQPEHKGHF